MKQKAIITVSIMLDEKTENENFEVAQEFTADIDDLVRGAAYRCKVDFDLYDVS